MEHSPIQSTMLTTDALLVSGFFQVKSDRPVRGAAGEKGFSFPELLVVVSILAVAVSIAIPNVVRWLEDYRLKGTSRQLVTDLQNAKMRAVAGKVQYRVAFESGNNRYKIEQGNSPTGSTAWAQLGIYRNLSDSSNAYYSNGVTLSENFPSHTVIFSPTGQASPAGTVTFNSPHLTTSVTVTLTGRIRIG